MFTVDLTWHLEGTAGVRAGWRMREGGAAAAASWRARVAVYRRGGKSGGHCVDLSKGFWEGGILRHVRLILL